MKTKITRVLQVGDIHLPEWPSKTTDIDIKDGNFSKEIIGELTQDRLSQVLKALNKVANSGSVDAVALMGDYTSRGDIKFIRPAVQIMRAILRDDSNERQPLVFGVPGNHDVAKETAAIGGPIVKFDPIQQAFKEFGFLELPVEDCIVHQISAEHDVRLPVYLLNSSIGSMSMHLLPKPLSDEFTDDKLGQEAIELVGKEPVVAAEPAFGHPYSQSSNRLHQLYKQLDTPYFSKTALDTLLDQLDKEQSSFAFLCAHHNLLPQRVPRISPYSEMLNAGLVRSHLLGSGKNIVYLHGHIHEGPVEQVVRTTEHGTERPNRQLLCISAPPIWEGFNEVAFFHQEDGEVFLVRLIEYRPDENGRIGNYSDQRATFFPLIADNRTLLTRNARKLWDRLRDSKRLNWREAVDECGSLHINEDELEHLLLLLFCAGVVELVNLGKPRAKWRIVAMEGLGG
ncbi:metallophosphoesterase [uncultured Roseobacter sp.]|uniref:metallophosphoesterase n=1 Tax=uncultured Roseobacter sp. TaxID=114847 RepID=UPI0026272312|nr:metallophosphoesterase [uncultured Roseobacter sp.]